MTTRLWNCRRPPCAHAALMILTALTALVVPRVEAQTPASGCRVVLTAPMLACLLKTDGTQPPQDTQGKDAKPPNQEEEIFFIIAGKDGANKSVVSRSPQNSHLMMDSTGLKRIYKNLTLWEGTLKEGEHATFVVNVRERDANDTADADLKEAEEIAKAVDNAKSLDAAVRIHAAHILAGGEGGKGENDHVGSVVVRVSCEKGQVRLQALADENAADLKGHPKNHPTRRAFQLDGAQGDFRLILEAAEQKETGR